MCLDYAIHVGCAEGEPYYTHFAANSVPYVRRGPRHGNMGHLLRNDGVQALADDSGRLGGLGLRSASRSAPKAFWASWVNALPIIADKMPAIADEMIRELQTDTSPTTDILRQLASCKWQLEQHGATEP